MLTDLQIKKLTRYFQVIDIEITLTYNGRAGLGRVFNKSGLR